MPARVLMPLLIVAALTGCNTTPRHALLVTTEAVEPEETATPERIDVVEATEVPAEQPVRPATPEPIPHNQIDRSTWAPIPFSAADGRVRHQPSYYSRASKQIKRDDPLAAGDAETAVLIALDGQKPGNWNADNAYALFAEPVWAAGELVMLPFKMVIQPPWQSVTSPTAE